ncbi:hypothetical protein I308_102301 [Cryptococcus tetragattii IND107]|uniref:Uncharacterized protein n=1 Tax=Cryptococcus tetragattii IND107 TaxID=1296105 RepID=A0ABR3BWZ0_9TREE|nr:hypothetical protein I308_02424 [Cryptococcus tetragattii IND107]
MFLSAKRTFNLLLHTPIIPPTPGPQAIELATIPSTSAAFPTAAPPRLRARTISNLSVRGYDPSSPYYRSVGIQKRGYAERKTDEEAYPEEAEGTEAGSSDVSHSNAAFNKDANPETAAKGVEQEIGKDYTRKSPANPNESRPSAKQGEKGSESPLNTSSHPAGR